MKFEPFNTIGDDEIRAAIDVLGHRPLSGFLGGIDRGGYYVQKLEEAWCEQFNVKHAIACNSATSGLLAACVACGVEPGSPVGVPAYTMSATAAAPKHLGAEVRFADIEPETFSAIVDTSSCTTAIVTNLFGHVAKGAKIMRRWADEGEALYVIEDNAQAPFAMDGNQYGGTIGHIGVWSLNVHKHVQCGEGGIVTTDSEDLAVACRRFINHGELANDRRVGLNLRMSEITAAIGYIQLIKGPVIVNERVEQAEFIIDCLKDFEFLRVPVVRQDCRHVYYCVALLFNSANSRGPFVTYLRDCGLPIREGYVTPLNLLPAFDRYPASIPVTWDVESRIAIIENCAFTISPKQHVSVREAFRIAADEVGI